MSAVLAIVIYLVAIHHKATPAPPMLRFVLVSAVLLWIFNIAFAGSVLGRWGIQKDAVVSGAHGFREANVAALRVLSTGMSIAVLLVALRPRGVARALDGWGVTAGVSESGALMLRSLSNIEVDVRAILRAWTLRTDGIRSSPAMIAARVQQLMVAVLASALQRARFASRSFWIHGVRIGEYRPGYRDGTEFSSTLALALLAAIQGVLCFVL